MGGAGQPELLHLPVEAIRRLNPPPASELNGAVSHLISRVVHKAMAKQGVNRYDSAKEFGEILQRAAHNLPIEIFDPARIQPRIERAKKAIGGGDYQFAGEIVSELEAAGNIDPQLTELRADIDKAVRQRTIAQLYENAQTRFEEEEDPLALQKIHEILQLDPGNMKALGLKSKVERRRSERQVDQWVKLAQQHIDNHSYSHARDALQNVLALQPKETRALRLAKQLEADEQEYLRLRQEKAELYQSAVDAWKNGDVSEALSHMRVVLELDGRAPDISSPERAASYQSFYNKIRSEHEALNAGYAEARRHLSERDFARALEMCDEFLARYPGQPLFQALKFDVEEQHRQGLSACIADINRRLEAEPDLDAKVSLVREAATLYPDEPHFERLVKLMEEKRDLVRSIVKRAEGHEERGQITEALGDYATLQAIYEAYPGLKYEIERLQKRLEQRTRDASRAAWVRKVDLQLETGNYACALEHLDKAEADFPGNPELVELRRLTEQGFERARQAEQLLADGQRLCAEGRIDEGTAALREAYRLDDHNAASRTALRDILLDRARSMIDSDWHEAETLIDDALELDPLHPVAKSLRTQLSDHKRDEIVVQCATQARRLQADKALEKAEAELKRVLEIYPGEARLTAILETVQKELGNSSRRKLRASEIDQLRGLVQRVQNAGENVPPPIVDQTRPVAGRDDAVTSAPDVDALTRELAPVVAAEDAGSERRATPTAATAATAAPTRDPRSPAAKPAAAKRGPGLLANRYVWGASVALVLLAVSIGAIARYRAADARDRSVAAVPAAVKATVRVRTSPPGGSITIDGQAQATSDVQVALDPGDHRFDATLAGYAPAARTMTLTAGAESDVELALEPIADTLRVRAPEDGGELSLDGAAVALESGGATRTIASAGTHLLRIAGARGSNQEAKIAFTTAAATMPNVTLMDVPQRQVVAVSAFGGVARITGSGNTAIAVDGRAQGTLRGDGVTVRDLAPGPHELTIGDGKDSRKVSFVVGPGPSLDAFLYADRAAAPAVAAVPAAAPTATPTTTPTAAPTATPTTTPSAVPAAAPTPPATSAAVPLGSMDGFERAGDWSRTGTWFTRRGGGFALYGQPRPLGRIAFTLKPRRSRNFLRGGPRVRWVAGYGDPRNYMLVEMDDKYFYRSEVVDGKKTDLPRVEHGISWENPFFNIAVEVTEQRLIHQFSLEKAPWTVFDTWDRRSSGSAASTRTFADGKFGFYLPGNDEIEVSNFAFYPAAGR
jgi:hypothetical protein